MTLGGSPKGVDKCQICCVLGLFFVHFHFSPLILLPSALPSPTSPLSHFSPPPFPKEVNKKLSYRGQNALSVIKKDTNAITTANIYCIPYARLDA